jgi:hypothetical protein
MSKVGLEMSQIKWKLKFSVGLYLLYQVLKKSVQLFGRCNCRMEIIRFRILFETQFKFVVKSNSVSNNEKFSVYYFSRNFLLRASNLFFFSSNLENGFSYIQPFLSICVTWVIFPPTPRFSLYGFVPFFSWCLICQASLFTCSHKLFHIS